MSIASLKVYIVVKDDYALTLNPVSLLYSKYFDMVPHQ